MNVQYSNLDGMRFWIFQEIVDGLKSRGHGTHMMSSAGSVVTGISVAQNGEIHAYSDKRKAGSVDGF